MQWIFWLFFTHAINRPPLLVKSKILPNKAFETIFPAPLVLWASNE